MLAMIASVILDFSRGVWVCVLAQATRRHAVHERRYAQTLVSLACVRARFLNLLTNRLNLDGPMAEITVDYYLAITSPWTFLGHDEFVQIAKDSGATVNVKPVDLGAVFEVSGGLPLPQRPVQRQRYRLFELQRWRRRRNVPLNLHPAYFPANHNLGNKAVLAASVAGGDSLTLAGELMRGIWCADKNVADPAYIIETAAAIGMDGNAIVAAAESDEIERHYRALTEEAKVVNVFGAPTYVVNGEPWWGQDRLDFVREVLSGEVETLPEAT